MFSIGSLSAIVNGTRFISSDRYRRGLSSLKWNVANKLQQVAGPTPHKVQYLVQWELGAIEKALGLFALGLFAFGQFSVKKT